jgi:hypothetical protein
MFAAMLWLQAAPSPCDPRLVQPGTDPNGYRLRGDRCEGVFVQPVAGSASLLVASFVETFAEFNPRTTSTLPLVWSPAQPSKPTLLRAYGLRRRQYYRMDAERPAGIRSYTWPATILGNLDLSRQFLGVLAWNEIDVGGQARRVYLPLAVGATPNAPGGSFELQLVAGTELTEVYLTLAAVSETGATRRTYWQRRRLGRSFYPAQQPITIPITGLEESGLHRLDIAVAQRDGGSANAEVWFARVPR